LRPDNFFDFAFAKTAWSSWSFKQLDGEFRRNCPNGGVFEQWRARKRSNPIAAMAELETHPQADLIRRCWDVALAYERVWLPMYRVWTRSLGSVTNTHRPRRWGQCSDGITNLLMRDSNIFTHRCDDMPDWRTPHDAAANEREMKRDHSFRLLGKKIGGEEGQE